jgi:hypothetical protein
MKSLHMQPLHLDKDDQPDRDTKITLSPATGSPTLRLPRSGLVLAVLCGAPHNTAHPIGRLNRYKISEKHFPIGSYSPSDAPDYPSIWMAYRGVAKFDLPIGWN